MRACCECCEYEGTNERNNRNAALDNVLPAFIAPLLSFLPSFLMYCRVTVCVCPYVLAPWRLECFHALQESSEAFDSEHRSMVGQASLDGRMGRDHHHVE